MTVKARKSFKTVNSEGGTRTPFRVFLIHGRSSDWKRVKKFIEEVLNFEVVVSVERFTGEPLIEKIRRQVWFQCDCAVAILSADDQRQDSSRTARPNVIFELGYCMGFFDFRYWESNEIESVILISEDKTELPSDLAGIERITYSNEQEEGISQSFGILQQALGSIYL
jgi:predicted nucleotide-binding protein